MPGYLHLVPAGQPDIRTIDPSKVSGIRQEVKRFAVYPTRNEFELFPVLGRGTKNERKTVKYEFSYQIFLEVRAVTSAL